jgi:beta-glucosidase
MDPTLSPDRRAERLVRAMTLEEKIAVVRGDLAMVAGALRGRDKGALGSAGFVPGVERLGVPPLQESDASLGVANPFDVRKGDGATPLPAGLATAASFNVDLAYAGGAMIGAEARAKGFDVLLAGGVNLARDPRNGRNFEYLGEDPLLTGLMGGAAIAGVQAQGVVSTIKHFALNDQETGRMVLDARIDEAAFRESDLLAFEIAIERGRPGAVMCSYNQVNGAYACDNDHLLNAVLKTDWRFAGFVMSDWGAVRSSSAAAHGLDQESGSQLDPKIWFDAPLKADLQAGRLPLARLDDMVRRIMRSLIAAGVFERPATAGSTIDYAADAKVAERVSDEGIVLLKNNGLLPLSGGLRRILVVGGHADVGVLSGGGSSQVAPAGGAALKLKVPGGEGNPMASFRIAVYDPSSPLAAIRAAAPGARVDYLDGADPAEAARQAAGADAVVVFAVQWMIEGYDARDLALPDGQDALIAALAAANPRTVVVLETGGPVKAPWLGGAAALLEAWYPGAAGGRSIADILFGAVNPSGRLPISFPRQEEDLPRPVLPGADAKKGEPIVVDYVEGADVGYRWYAKKGLTPLFPFGYGLSYTHFAYSGLKVQGGRRLRVRFKVVNTGARAGKDAPQVYAAPPGGGLRLIGFRKIDLRPGEARTLEVDADPRLLAAFDAAAGRWRLAAGRYDVAVGASSADLTLRGGAVLSALRLRP